MIAKVVTDVVPYSLLWAEIKRYHRLQKHQMEMCNGI